MEGTEPDVPHRRREKLPLQARPAVKTSRVSRQQLVYVLDPQTPNFWGFFGQVCGRIGRWLMIEISGYLMTPSIFDDLQVAIWQAVGIADAATC